jgi:hypothetical protein
MNVLVCRCSACEGAYHRCLVTVGSDGITDKGNRMCANYERDNVEYVDATPKWEDVFLIYVTAAANGNQAAISELRRMAQLADLHNESPEVERAAQSHMTTTLL